MPFLKTSSTWSSNGHLNLAILSYSVGLTIPQMTSPWLLKTKVGIPLLVPTLVFIAIVNIVPGIFLELALGQYSNKGVIKQWDLCPALRGIGICSFFMFLMYQVHYTFLCNCTFCFASLSFSYGAFWKSCNNTWNKINCFTLRDNYSRRFECSQKYSVEKCDQMKWQSSVEQFYDYRILDLNDNSAFAGAPQEELLLYGLITMFIVFLSNCGGPKTTEKIILLLAIVPTLQIVILFFVPLLGPNPGLVLHHLFTSFDRTQLKDFAIWTQLIQLTLTSSGLGFGAYVTFGTHFPFRSPIHFRTIGISLTGVLFTVFYTIVLQNFVVSLFLQNKMLMEDFINLEQELKIPEAVFFLDHSSQFWATMWLSNSYFLGLRSLIVMMTINAEVVYNTFPAAKKRHKFCILLFSVLIYSGGIFFSTRTGYFTGKIIDKIMNDFNLVLLNTLNLIGVVYFYGIRKFRHDVFFMLGIKPSVWWNVFYVLNPIFMGVILLYNLYHFYAKSESDTLSWGFKFGNALIWSGAVFVLLYGFLYAMIAISKNDWNIFNPMKTWRPRDKALARSREMFDVYNTSREYLYRRKRFSEFGESEV